MIVATKIGRIKIEIEHFIIFIGKIMNEKLFVFTLNCSGTEAALPVC